MQRRSTSVRCAFVEFDDSIWEKSVVLASCQVHRPRVLSLSPILIENTANPGETGPTGYTAIRPLFVASSSNPFDRITHTATMATTMTMSAACAQPLAARKAFGSKAKLAAPTKTRVARRNVVTSAKADGPVVIGLAADSGCGKSTFMRRMTSLFGGKATPPEGGNPDSNTLISDTTTVLCLDDYHLNDRQGRKESGLTALNLAEQDFGACAIPTVETNPDPTRIALQRLRPRSRGPDRDS
jgi:hypothetical protein